jgi:magnesium chelatase family protein
MDARLTRRTVLLRDAARARPALERLSGRGQDRVLRLARTIADLAESADVLGEHFDEAVGYRLGDSHRAAA